MSISLGANGGSYNYPQENDPAGWGDDATNWASAVSAALSNIGLGGTASADAVVNIISTTKGILIPRMTTTQRNAIGSPSTSLLIYNTTTTQYELYTGSTWQSLASYISGNLTVTGNTTLGDASGDTLTITGNAVSTPNGLNIDSNTLVVDATNNRVGVVTASPTVALDVTGDIKSSSTIQSANGTATDPGITFSGDTNTGIYNIAADTIGFSAGGAERARIDSNGIELIDGTAANPSIAFSSDPDTGLYRIGADVIGVATNGTLVGQFNTNGLQALDNLLHIQDQKPSGTAAQSITSGAWRTRDLNTVLTNRISGASLSSNAITLPAGTYFVSAITEMYRGGETSIRLYQTSGTPTQILLGPNSYMGPSPDGASNPSLAGEFVLASQQTIEFQIRVNSTFNGGTAHSWTTEVYSNICIWKKS